MVREKPDVVARILQSSFRVSQWAPPLKPFVRFAPALSSDQARRWWDFDDRVQKRLLVLLRAVAGPDTIARACTDQWAHTLDGLAESSGRALERCRATGQYPPVFDRESGDLALMQASLPAGGRLLYVGAGTGTECFQHARQGLEVVGIDTLIPLLTLAGRWTALLRRPARFAGADVLHLAFPPRSFDGVVLEFYGAFPDPAQVKRLQCELARVLKPGGRGFITAARKKYPSYWFRMGSALPDALVAWLAPQSALDFHFDAPDGCEERLSYGFFNRCHTVASLAAELDGVFEVIDCRALDDPRYVRATVTPRPPGTSAPPESALRAEDAPWSDRAPGAVAATLDAVEQLCDRLEAHAEQVAAYFAAPDATGGGCFRAVVPDLPPIVALLERITGDPDSGPLPGPGR